MSLLIKQWIFVSWVQVPGRGVPWTRPRPLLPSPLALSTLESSIRFSVEASSGPLKAWTASRLGFCALGLGLGPARRWEASGSASMVVGVLEKGPRAIRRGEALSLLQIGPC